MALVIVALGLVAAELIQPIFGIENVDLVFLTAVVSVAVRFGLWPSLLASVAGSLCYNFFFLPPVYTFTITDPTNVAAFFFFMLIAILVSNVAARVRTQAVAAIGRVRTTELLYAFSRKLAGTATLDDVLWATAYQIALMLKVRVVLLLPEEDVLTVKAGYPPEDQLDKADLAAANWAWGNDRPAGRGSDTLPGAKRLFLPMRTGRGPIGVDRHRRRQDRPAAHAGPAPAARRAGGSGRAGDRAGAAGRGYGSGQAHRGVGPPARGAADLDLARSQDAARLGARRRQHACAISPAVLREAEKRDLLATVIDESERLNRFIANLLDMTKLESGAIVPNAALQDIGEIVGSALRRAGKILAHHKVSLELAADCRCWSSTRCCSSRCCSTCWTMRRNMPPPSTTISIRSPRDRDSILLQIIDEGDGIPPGELESVFDKFYRAQKGDHVRPGTGLGLAISRGFVEAMHGTIAAANRSDRSGAMLTIRLPIPAASDALDTAA